MRFTEAVVIGYFPDDVKLALSRSFHGTRFRQQGEISPPFVADILVAAFKDVRSDAIVDFVREAVGDFNAVLVIDDDFAELTRTIRITRGVVDNDSGDE